MNRRDLEKGDRVRVYGSSQTGLFRDTNPNRQTGTVIAATTSMPGWVNVKLDHNGQNFTFHAKQLRRLKPRPPTVLIDRKKLAEAYGKAFGHKPEVAEERGVFIALAAALGLPEES